MTNTLRQRRRLMLETEILDATQEILLTRGYAALSMDDLAAQVGISKPTLYSHFATKDDIIIATLLRMIEQFFDLVACIKHLSPLQQLTTILERIFDAHEFIKVLSQPISHEVLLLIISREESHEALKRINSTIVGIIQDGIDQGEIDSAFNADVVASTFFAYCHSFHPHKPIFLNTQHPEAAKMLVTMFVRSVTPTAKS